MPRCYALLLAAALACADGHRVTVVPLISGGGSGELRVGDYVVYRFSGTFTDKPVTLREEVVAEDARRVTLDLHAVRGHEERHWVQVGPSSADGRWTNAVDEIYVVHGDGTKQRLPNPDNTTLARLYEWVLMGADGEATAQGSSPCEQEIASARVACTCDHATRGGRMTIQTEESRCPTFAWQRGPARWSSGDDVLWQVEVVETGAR